MSNNFPSAAHDATPETFATNDVREHRRRTYKAGIISYHDGSLTCNATVRDITSNGAKLLIDNNRLVPDRFLLTIPIDAVSVECEVRWRDENRMGVGFNGEWEPCQRNARVQSFDVSKLVARKPTLRKSR